MDKHTILILDFGGSNQAQSLARMLRGAGIYTEILPYNAPIDLITQANPQGILRTGGREPLDQECDYGVWLMRTPVLAMGASARQMIRQLGGDGYATEEALILYPAVLRGGIVDACNDHRIAMAAAIAATVCAENVTVLGAEAVQKSYPGFWEEYERLGGVL